MVEVVSTFKHIHHHSSVAQKKFTLFACCSSSWGSFGTYLGHHQFIAYSLHTLVHTSFLEVVLLSKAVNHAVFVSMLTASVVGGDNGECRGSHRKGEFAI